MCQVTLFLESLLFTPHSFLIANELFLEIAPYDIIQQLFQLNKSRILVFVLSASTCFFNFLKGFRIQAFPNLLKYFN